MKSGLNQLQPAPIGAGCMRLFIKNVIVRTILFNKYSKKSFCFLIAENFIFRYFIKLFLKLDAVNAAISAQNRVEKNV